MTDTPIDRLRATHIEERDDLGPYCARDATTYPCDTIAALDALTVRLQEQVETNMELAGLAGQQQLDAIALQARLDAVREQAEALATALDEQDAVRVTPYEVDLAVKMFNRNGGRWESESDEELVMKWEWRKRNAIELAIVALRAYREGGCPGCSFRRQTGGNHDDVPTGDADPNCPYREGS